MPRQTFGTEMRPKITSRRSARKYTNLWQIVNEGASMETPEQIRASSSFVFSSAPQSHNTDPSRFFVLKSHHKSGNSMEHLAHKRMSY